MNKYRILILGASYGSLLGIKLALADHDIDLGPEGGDRGGRIVYQGIPKNCISKPESHTGKFLEPSFNFTAEDKHLWEVETIKKILGEIKC